MDNTLLDDIIVIDIYNLGLKRNWWLVTQPKRTRIRGVSTTKETLIIISTYELKLYYHLIDKSYSDIDILTWLKEIIIVHLPKLFNSGICLELDNQIVITQNTIPKPRSRILL